MCCALSTEEVEHQLAWGSGDVSRGFSAPCPDGLSGPRPAELKTCAAQSPHEEPGRAADVAPQRLVHCRLVCSRAAAIGSPYILVVDEELVEAGELAHPPDAEEAWRSAGLRLTQVYREAWSVVGQTTRGADREHRYIFLPAANPNAAAVLPEGWPGSS